jgi:hypothetical protein
MYIEFQLLPTGHTLATDMSTHHLLLLIKQEIDRWIKQHGVVGYSQKTIKYTHRLGFNNEKYFSLFSMTWTSEIPYRIVNIENEKY